MIEHVVLYRFKPDAEQSQITEMMNGLNSMISIEEVSYLSAGPLLHIESSSLTFTHMLHSHSNSEDDLKAYTVHLSQVSLVNMTVIIYDIMAVDWVTEDALAPVPGSVIKFVFLKMKDGLAQKDYVLEVIRETCTVVSLVPFDSLALEKISLQIELKDFR